VCSSDLCDGATGSADTGAAKNMTRALGEGGSTDTGDGQRDGRSDELVRLHDYSLPKKLVTRKRHLEH
jgi:hypothetical protein